MSFVDEFPLRWDRPEPNDVVVLLSNAYYLVPHVVAFVQRAGMSPGSVDLSGSARDVWIDVLQKAANQQRLRAVIDAVRVGGDAAVVQRLDELLGSDPVVPAPPGPAVAWVDSSPRGDVEKILADEPTYIDSAFLRRGAVLAMAVVRLLVRTNKGSFHGTGFRVTDDLVLSNHHVLFPTTDRGKSLTLREVEVWADYERTVDGEDRPHRTLTGEVASIKGQLDHDWAVLRVADLGPDVSTIDLTDAGTVDVDDRVYIVQHPGGGPKKIGMVHNLVRHVDDDVVQYLTDTEGGSSGSPVFDERWRIVALHHRWTHRDGQDRNQGQRIERVLDGIWREGISLGS